MSAGKGDIQLAVDQGKEFLAIYKKAIEGLIQSGDLDAVEEFKRAYASVANAIKLLLTPELQNTEPVKARSVSRPEMNEAELEEEDHIKKGKFTAWCKSKGHDGPSKECAREAMASNSTSAHKMATFYTNTVKP